MCQHMSVSIGIFVCVCQHMSVSVAIFVCMCVSTYARFCCNICVCPHMSFCCNICLSVLQPGTIRLIREGWKEWRGIG